MQTRRTFLRRGAATAGGAALALGPGAALAKQPRRAGYGPVVEDPGGLLDLPRGFRYRVIQNVEDRLSDGAPVPADFDGMVAIPGRGNSIVLVRNHELRANDVTAGKAPVAGRNPYDPAAPGGTTAVVVGPDRRVRRSYVTSRARSTTASAAAPRGARGSPARRTAPPATASCSRRIRSTPRATSRRRRSGEWGTSRTRQSTSTRAPASPI